MNTIPTHKEPTCTLQQGRVPLLVSMPHIGTAIAPDLRAHYMPRALQVEDTDWHLERLYNFLGELGASVLTPTLSRYVIDLNRPPDDAPMYPGASNTELCPTRFFTGEPLYQEGQAPDVQARALRRALLAALPRRLDFRAGALEGPARLCAAVGCAQHPLRNPLAV